MDVENEYGSSKIWSKRLMNPSRENRRQAELDRMSKRVIYVPTYRDHARGSEYIGHRKVILHGVAHS